MTQRPIPGTPSRGPSARSGDIQGGHGRKTGATQAGRPPDTLARYREKRDFSRTPEPAGVKGGERDALAFVVQRHAASRLHYDFRLEWHGVLKSWAVTRGPSLDPADKRLAVEVEDHPLDYASFEGTIPEPDYGGGTVQLWDRGRWTPAHPDRVDADLSRGELKFVLSGERLKAATRSYA